MKKHLTNMLMLTTLLLSSCHNSTDAKNKANADSETANDRIVRIEYKHYGGEAGLSEMLSITQNSTCYSYSLYIDKNNARRYDIPTIASIWTNLLLELDLATFKKIKTGVSLLPVDGTDEEFSAITESGEEYSFINGSSDASYKKLQPFFNLFFQQLNECMVNSLP